MDNLDLIDTKALLNGLDIEYTESGKNVTSGWINITCPFCHDSSNHCGINLKSNLFHCWVCQSKGSIVRLIKEIKDISFHKSETIIRDYLMESSLALFGEINTDSANSVRSNRETLVYPTPFQETIPEPHRQYLLSRNFDPDLLTKKYGLKFTYNTGAYRFKIIAPIFIDGKAVSWIAADVIRKRSLAPYIKCPLEMSIVSANSCLYNIDSAKTTAILVEGITDVWRCGDGVVASMTKSITPEQILLLEQKGIKKVFVMYDSDAVNSAKKTANKLSGLFETEVIELSEGDPADLSSEEVSEIRNLLK